MVTLGEGRTPLLAAPRLSERFGVDLRLKWEGANPTGSFKDRGMALAVTRGLERGVTRLVCASTGNTAASCAAYAARAGIEAVIVVAAGATASSKLVQVRAVGGRIVEVDGTFEDAFAHAEELSAEPGSLFVNSGGNDDRLEGQSSAAVEIVEELGGLPDVLTLPYGGGGNTRAYALGFERAAGALPRLVPVESGERPTTFGSAIRIVEPVHRAQVGDVIARSGGEVVTVTDDELRAAWKLLRTEEGVFSEPASAAGIAGLAHGSARAGELVVCVVTGHGLKDPASVDR
ncbi:MAG TPA: pyridoxal-phosphate dependent enzyme [Gaiellaceae bacterium]|nr:pyridoxal-phosphate dependent enzyme [Gaiellaceae bacterium]